MAPTQFDACRRRFAAVLLAAYVAAAPLVTLGEHQGAWNPPCLVGAADPPFASPVEAAYSVARAADAAGQPTCIEYYLQAAVGAWPAYSASGGCGESRIDEVYRSSVRGFLLAAARWGRFDPRQGVRTGARDVPVAYHGFPWRPADFDAVVAVGDYRAEMVSRRYTSPGVGVGFVAFSSESRAFMRDGAPFAATVLLRPRPDLGPGAASLEFYDPVRRTNATGPGGLPLHRDISAPLAYAAIHNTDSRWTEFLRPGAPRSDDGLRTIEPYQRGKIPVVFVHGLLADALTWADLVNELRVAPDIVERYQFWAFRYETGAPFLTSAARLRRQLREIRATYDPDRSDAALSHMVVLGHSLGGLVSKLQVAYSGDDLWNAASNRPLDAIHTDAATRAALREAFYFAPSPDIDRVVFLATPHNGSVWADRTVGRLGSAMVHETPQQRARLSQLLRDNPGVFSREVRRRIPNSIDLLKPESELLRAVGQLPVRGGVVAHSIIGCIRNSPVVGPTDGVVSVRSAHLPGAESEATVDARHGMVHRVDDSIREVARILREHAHAVESGGYSIGPQIVSISE